MFFLNDFSEIEKIFIIILILAKIRSKDYITLTIVSLEITIILLDRGMTIYSQFKILINIQVNLIYNILVRNLLIVLIRDSILIF
jgi:hypothetical protein